jgi:hypothetical protein
MMQLVDVKKDAAEQPAPKTQPIPEEKAHPLALRIEALEVRVAPAMFNPKEY